ncbi:Hypp374 [Branchiostoma lanceolatum]|uniref:Hypp374 protein n=1 Tax=Branchiostoma lanceolatum TaxID=7740 RepID=A0A8J9W3H2_BRALA|nr:Hypp374 [Branchiostoma lanceolatum]
MGTGLTALCLVLQVLLYIHLSEGGRTKPAARKQYFYNCFPPWHQHCQTSGSAILRRRTGSKLVRRRPLPAWEFDASAEDGLPLLGDLQEWLSDGAWTLPRETASDGSGSDHHAAKGIERRQLPNRHPGAKIRSQGPGSNEQR